MRTSRAALVQWIHSHPEALNKMRNVNVSWKTDPNNLLLGAVIATYLKTMHVNGSLHHEFDIGLVATRS